MASLIFTALWAGSPYVLAWWLHESVQWERRNG